jgi:outer membrane putative beta-barrel porin/alpha-amylase
VQTTIPAGQAFAVRVILLGALLAPLVARSAAAQTDYYNTDAGRPVTIEDASPVERRAFEIQAAPLRLERARPGVYTWGLEPELAYGILPRTQVEVGLPLALIDRGIAGRTSGLAGVDLSILHNFNLETAIPALAIAADVLLPVGGLGPDRAYASVKGIATRTLPQARFHVNAGYTFGDEPNPTSGAAVELSRWLAGLAVDRAFPLRSTLITAEVVARQPIHDDEAVEWSVGTGVRRQLTSRWAIDGGVGRRLTGATEAWYATVGTAYAFGLPWRPR